MNNEELEHLKKLVEEAKRENEDEKHDLKKILKQIRKENKETMTDMAKKIGYSHSYLSFIESGKRPIPKDFKERILKNYRLDEKTVRKLQKAEIIEKDNLIIDLTHVSKEKKNKLINFLGENDML